MSDYIEMIKQIGKEKFYARLKELLDTADKFIEESGYKGNVECNERIMTTVLLDFYADIFRLKDFHNIEKERTEKIIAYTVAWIIKRKPLQFIKFTEDERDIFVNERFAAYLMINECLTCGQKIIVLKDNKKKLDEYIELLFYYFKYRECNPQVIELAIESFKMGTLVIKDN